MALLALGMAVFALLLGGPVTVGGVTFDIAALILASALILVGFQLVCFYGLARQFSVRFGFLPTSQRFEKLSQEISVDRACQFGGALVLAAIVATIGSFVLWSNAGWGDLNPSVIARPAAFVVVSASLGVQTVTVGFLWGMFSQRIDHKTEETQPALVAATN